MEPAAVWNPFLSLLIVRPALDIVVMDSTGHQTHSPYAVRVPPPLKCQPVMSPPGWRPMTASFLWAEVGILHLAAQLGYPLPHSHGSVGSLSTPFAHPSPQGSLPVLHQCQLCLPSFLSYVCAIPEALQWVQ